MWQQEFKLVFTAYGAQFEDWGVCATFYRISSSHLAFHDRGEAENGKDTDILDDEQTSRSH